MEDNFFVGTNMLSSGVSLFVVSLFQSLSKIRASRLNDFRSNAIAAVEVNKTKIIVRWAR